MDNQEQEKRIEELNSGKDRDNYARDRARIIHSAFFRRLQGKTQVLGLGESDFYRTRLTHSLEVAQIASGIAEHLRNREDCAEYKSYIPNQNFIETIGLAHDIGHPPFGHGGEYALNYLMRNHGGFEGNAQTLRICTQLGEYSEHNGLNLTRRVLLGLIKYPAMYEDVLNRTVYQESKAPINIDSFKPPKYNIFECDKNKFKWILEPFSDKDIKLFKETVEIERSHKKTKYKSFDCTIMELADDISYGVHDLEDAISLNFIIEKHWREYEYNGLKLENIFSDYPNKEFINNLFSGKNKVRKKAISYLVNYFASKVEINPRKIFENELLDLKASIPENIEKELEVLKKFVSEKVVKTPEVQTLEYKGQGIIIKLFDAIANNPERLLEKKHYQIYQESKNCSEKLRAICDYIAGDTDEYATRLYHKIFTPSNGSIFDRL